MTPLPRADLLEAIDRAGAQVDARGVAWADGIGPVSAGDVHAAMLAAIPDYLAGHRRKAVTAIADTLFHTGWRWSRHANTYRRQAEEFLAWVEAHTSTE